uniref:BED-type domain-containing protein n=1 Tax=Rhabditophanes sp. KR3021 TaxID=114890 RepID=A0AC35TYD7_9BILA
MFSGMNSHIHHHQNQINGLPFPYINHNLNLNNGNNNTSMAMALANSSQMLDSANPNQINNLQFAQQLNLLGNLHKIYMNQLPKTQPGQDNTHKNEINWDTTNSLINNQPNPRISINFLNSNNSTFKLGPSTPLPNSTPPPPTISAKSKKDTLSGPPKRTTTRTRGGPAQKTAKVWRFFDELTTSEEQAATCKICLKTIKATNSSTTGMIRHLRSCHHEEYQVLQEARLTSMLEKVGKLDENEGLSRIMFEDPTAAIAELQKQHANDLKKEFLNKNNLMKIIVQKISKRDKGKHSCSESEETSTPLEVKEDVKMEPDATQHLEVPLDYSVKPDKMLQQVYDMAMKCEEEKKRGWEMSSLSMMNLEHTNQTKNQMGKRGRMTGVGYAASTSNDTDEESPPSKRKYNKRSRKQSCVLVEKKNGCGNDYGTIDTITNSLALLCSNDGLEAEVIYRKGFGSFLNVIAPTYSLPDINHFKSIVNHHIQANFFSSSFRQNNPLLNISGLLAKINDSQGESTLMHSPTATVTSVGTSSSIISNNGEGYDVLIPMAENNSSFKDYGSEGVKNCQLLTINDPYSSVMLMNSVRNQYVSNDFSHSIDLSHDREQEKEGTDCESVSSIDSDLSLITVVQDFLKAIKYENDSSEVVITIKNSVSFVQLLGQNEGLKNLLCNGNKDNKIGEAVKDSLDMELVIKYANIISAIVFTDDNWERIAEINETASIPFFNSFTKSSKTILGDLHKCLAEPSQN